VSPSAIQPGRSESWIAGLTSRYRQIANHQAVVATTKKERSGDARGQRGAWEEALIAPPVADPE
jgi:Ni,Fe-hydrogenase I large subunit